MSEPKVSIVLPTYNRARFMPEAFASIAAQTFGDWELIVVDDGSTDDTRAVVAALAEKAAGPVAYVFQANAGAAEARNAGIARARGDYIAFFDSDDLWTPVHLAQCVAALDANPGVGWVFGAGRRVEIPSGKVISEHSFYRDGKPRPYMTLTTRKIGDLSIIEDPRQIEFVFDTDHTGGLQASVLRREVFERLSIPPFRVGEDWALTVRYLAGGGKIGYLPQVHTVYRIHGEQASSAGSGPGDVERRLRVKREHIRAVQSVADIESLTPRQRRALRRKLGAEYFWRLGYAILWTAGRRHEAMAAFREGLRQCPCDWRMRKTWLVCRLKCAFGAA